MKYLATFIILNPLFWFANSCIAQNADLSMLGSGGDIFSAENKTLEYSIGEVTIETFISNDYVLTQGFIQPNKIVTHYQQNQANPIQVKIYPNPLVSETNIAIANFSEELYLNILDLNGRKVFEQQIISKLTTLKLDGLHSGSYLLNIHDHEKNTCITTIVQKIK